MEEHYFSIAGLNICLAADYDLKLTEPFVPFVSAKADSEIYVSVSETHSLQTADTFFSYAGAYFKAQQSGRVNHRIFYNPDDDNAPYAEAELDFDRKTAEIRYLPWGIKYLCETGNCFFHIGWENFLAYESRFILHSCCVDTAFGGILFSGPSGIGKSTQGELWKKHEGAGVINGDRPILFRDAGRWYAYGSPYAGSSRYYVNARTPVRAIVMLRQAETCSIRRLNAADSFRSLYAMATVCVWDTEGTEKICSLLEQITAEVPIYELSCTPDEKAIETLKSAL